MEDIHLSVLCKYHQHLLYRIPASAALFCSVICLFYFTTSSSPSLPFSFNDSWCINSINPYRILWYYYVLCNRRVLPGGVIIKCFQMLLLHYWTFLCSSHFFSLLADLRQIPPLSCILHSAHFTCRTVPGTDRAMGCSHSKSGPNCRHIVRTKWTKGLPPICPIRYICIIHVCCPWFF